MSYTVFENIENIGILTLSRYQKRNAINLEFMNELYQIILNIKNMDIKALLVKSTGNVFCSGGDIDYFATLDSKEKAISMSYAMHCLLNEIENLEVPTIACINGSAVGGGAEFIMAFDIRFLESDSFIQFKEIQMGVTTGWGGTYRLVNIVGKSKALELLLSAKPIYAQEALKIGLINNYFDKEVIFEETFKFCKTFAQEDLNLIKPIKTLVKHSVEKTNNEAMAQERDVFSQTWMLGKRQSIMEKFVKRKK
ncbi:Enoyl-CoA hydratase [Desulfurella amilsii]|uniref:Enoyl-CoA hydratase n=1 Tax=Desulfurella amilsii TaxID=1562698 RepID=A0A1X4XZT7_9BACT|nr:enoyl-CoA hydratase/isomerase family protein [Desulfurella amilsii]OSS43040.1 Enoyl-CoA hydratase [Desulfurella amilsii]